MVAERAYPLNAWYPAAWSARNRPGAVRAKNLRQRHRALPSPGRRALRRWRTPAGTACCRCRSAGLRGDEVVCGYHGLVFNAAGRCTFMPAQKTINPSACVRAYPVVERHRLVWIWPGDPALADPAKLPDFHWNDGDGVERRRRDVRQPQMRLAARRRQSDGPHPRDLRPLRLHRPRRHPRRAVRGRPTTNARRP